MPPTESDAAMLAEPARCANATRSRFREIAPSRQPEFAAAGCRPSRFFPHRCYLLPKCGPDGFKLAQRMCGPVGADAMWEAVLYACPPQLDRFPPELFFDDELVWHRQQFGLPGQIATANLVLEGGRLHSMVHVSDIVQRIGRRREHKTRIENRFGGWVRMLLNAVLAFALERGAAQARTPTARLALAHTDPRRSPGAAMFERIYDRSVLAAYDVGRDGDWWTIDVERNRDRIVIPETREAPTTRGRVICVVHDVERGLGHRDIDPAFAAAADRDARGHLDAMLADEARAGVSATYSVVGALFAEERGRIEPHGHALAFHSYDHVAAGDGAGGQLARCRDVDYRVKGYRPPQSRLTAESSDENLLFHNFEWLASSRWSFGFGTPRMDRRLAKIPIACDDFALYSEGLAYEAWERQILAEVEAGGFVAFGLHDCYAGAWLPHYPRLLERLQGLGTLMTLDQVAADVTLANAA